MELRKSIENRRSIRKYKDIDVPNELIEDLIECARLAPSAKNRQPWYFIIVKDEIKDKIANMMIKYARENAEIEAKKDTPSSVEFTANVMKQAPILILAFKNKDEYWTTGDTLSLGGAIEHICLRATDLGLGSLWIRDIVYVSKEVAEMLGHSDLELNSAISIGYADQEPHQRPRKNLKEIIEWYK